MNLQKIQRLEDLRAEHSVISGQYNNLFLSRRKKFLQNALSESKKFFEEKKFNVTQSGSSIHAQYNTFNVDIAVPDEKTDYFGFISVIDMHINKKSFRIGISKLNEESHSSGYTIPNDEEAKLDFEIAKLEKQIPDMRKKVEEFESTKWGYGLYEDKQQMGRNETTYFNSFTELLADNFK